MATHLAQVNNQSNAYATAVLSESDYGGYYKPKHAPTVISKRPVLSGDDDSPDVISTKKTTYFFYDLDQKIWLSENAPQDYKNVLDVKDGDKLSLEISADGSVTFKVVTA
ncbi:MULTISPECIES: hypothetical protein [unclassified Streptomyces]|uniref:hypothetical protein n=1 Tax=unclassified Streptomyces TaxID=2593676 RepID=UPI0016604DD8|nr:MULTISPECIES: hypothetical protein [unclassified Streptomyces]MBD0709037.1 hypothetical protein [Streptomyces sp. CBMA291]MBD0715391.1 hypothetical protein [Streptomyces sp. CBMA370]